ncbi:MAG TPA: serine/threonine-protein kinase, partial [Thermoanaerobaculia bacterium]|nr:serine/threonine-protein kinase [Thermoanaerobaculia bacterium]
MSLTSGTRLGPYEIENQLGRGGMGEVYRARDTRLGREVAVKILPPTLASDPESVRRFEKEARAVASLSHPHVVPLFDVGEEGGLRYAVTELVSGETLRNRLAQGALPVREAAEIAAQIAEGLAAAHDRGVVHRDVKPDNVVLSASGFARILDFGLAKRTGSAIGVEADEDELTRSELLTEPGVVAGTVGYMSPEQVRGEAADGRSDIFSLGVVLWEMLTGRRPFTGDSHVETLNAILKEEPQPELALDGLPPELSRIVRRCLEKRKENRYHSAADLAHDLRSAVAEAPRSRTVAPTPRARPLRARTTPLVVGAAVLLAAIAVVVTLVVRRGRSAERAELPRTLAVLPFRPIGGEGMPPRFGLG